MRSQPTTKIPAYRRQNKPSGKSLGFVVLDGQRHYLGAWNSPESKEAYRRLIAEWLTSDPLVRAMKGHTATVRAASSHAPTVAELAAAYLRWCDSYYRTPDGQPTGEASQIERALKPLLDLYASQPAAEIGPRALKAVIGEMIKADRVRTGINQSVGRIKRMFRWGASEQIIPPSVHAGLAAVRGLAYGRSAARESEPVRPVSDETIEATIPFLPGPVAVMVKLQRLTGCRPGELLDLRPCDLDTSGKVWTVTLDRHKTRHHGHDRVLYFGRRARAVLKPLMENRAPHQPLFSPRDAERERLEKRRAARKTPLSCGNRPGSNRVAEPKRYPGEKYTVTSYARAIARGIERANQKREAEAKKRGIEKFARIEHWHPHRIRHTVATELRRRHGLEAARALLGHKSITVSQHYAEADERLAMALARQAG